MLIVEMLQIPVGPSTEMSGVAITSSSDTFSVGIETAVFVQCIFRPYARHAKQMELPSSSLPVSPEKDVSNDTAEEDAMEMAVVPVDTAVNMVTSDDRPATPMDDRSDDSIVVIKGMTSLEETEGVKRRWFRDDMRQSPVISR